MFLFLFSVPLFKFSRDSPPNTTIQEQEHILLSRSFICELAVLHRLYHNFGITFSSGYDGADTHYETQSLDWIKSLPVKDQAAKDCVLFMWAVSPLLPEAFEVINAWGFKYKTVAFCWNKTTKHGKWVSNLGRWTMGKEVLA